MTRLSYSHANRTAKTAKVCGQVCFELFRGIRDDSQLRDDPQLRIDLTADVSDEIPGVAPSPDNPSVALGDGWIAPVPPGSADVASSDQMIDHFHPDDAANHLHKMRNALKKCGVYGCITPNRLTGSRDYRKRGSSGLSRAPLDPSTRRPRPCQPPRPSRVATLQRRELGIPKCEPLPSQPGPLRPLPFRRYASAAATLGEAESIWAPLKEPIA